MICNALMPPFAGEHEMDNAKPVAKRFVGILKDRANQNGEPIAIASALLALPMPFARGEIVDGGIAAPRATRVFRPAPGLQVGFASILMRE
jgi:hypothetical protein